MKRSAFFGISLVISFGLVVFVLSRLLSLAQLVWIPQPTTPSALFVGLQSIEVSTSPNVPYISLYDQPIDIDVVGQTGKPQGTIASEVLRNDSFRAMRVTLSGISRYSGIDPCTGEPVTEAPIELPENESGLVVISFVTPDPALGLPTGAKPMQPFKIAGGINDFRFVFPVSNSVVCASSTPPERSFGGAASGLATPTSIQLDLTSETSEQLLVANSGIDTITIHERLQSANLSPTFGLIGATTSPDNTRLDRPFGIFLDNLARVNGTSTGGNTSVTLNDSNQFWSTDQYVDFLVEIINAGGKKEQHLIVANTATELTVSPPWTTTPDNTTPYEIRGDILYVTNSGDSKSVTAYNRNVVAETTLQPNSGNISPKQTIQGAKTKLNSPSGIYIDVERDEIIVANAGDNSLRFFSRDGSGDIDPVRSVIGPKTQLSQPLSVFVDASNNEIVVANFESNAITVYDRDATGDATPIRTIRGDRTDINEPSSILVDLANDEVVVANAGNDTVAFFSRTASGNAYPLRIIRGKATELNKPRGLAIDPENNELIVANEESPPTIEARITVHTRDGEGVQLRQLPVFVNTAVQQSITQEIFYEGIMEPSVDSPLASEGKPDSIVLKGYRYAWQIIDDRLRQNGDVSSARLLPPDDVVFELADGQVVSSLPLGCHEFTPFIKMRVFSSCGPSSLILSPYPPVSGDYLIPAGLLGQVTVTKLPIVSNPADDSQFPRPIPTIVQTPDGAIESISWKYLDDGIKPLLVITQAVQIILSRPYQDVSVCYQQVGAQAQTLVYTSGPLTEEVRFVEQIQNSNCPIFQADVDIVRLVATDALDNNFAYDWKFN